jgi:TRAP transporter 4TM/12TM fusion protein
MFHTLRQKPLIAWLAVLTALFHIYANTLGTLPTLWQNGLHFGLFAFLAFLTVPLKEGAAWKKMDVGLGLLILAATLTALIGENAIYERGVRLTALDWTVATLLILGAIELTRRLTGNIIPILIILALTYVGFWGGWLSGVFRFSGLSWETLIFRSIYGDDAIFGTIAAISATYVFMFILFGAFLLKSGAGDFIVDLARALAGRFVGGPGIVAVFASALTGTISGSAVANTVSTGVITIPLMKRSGFRPEFAAGVEAAASTGGQLMPPIMGAGAFVMAATTGISYGTIALMAILPALLYFASVIFFVRIEARKVSADIPAEAEADAPNLADVMREGGIVFLIPVVVLIGILIAGFTPTYAAGAGIIAAVATSWLTKKHAMGLEEIFDALELGSRNMVMTAVLLCAVGLIVNVIATTGLGPTFSLMISSWASGNLLIALALIALASLVLGMGLPVTASYIVLGTLSAPALYGMILDAQLTQMLVSGEIAEEVKVFFVMGSPASADLLAGPMLRAEASGLLDALPPELMSLIRDQVFSPAVAASALLSAHMIIFWLSQDSNVTPPVCLAAFSAAAVAGASPMRSGFAAWRIAKGLYIIPILMAYTALMSGDLMAMLEVTFFALFGLWALTSALEGHAKAPLGWPMRIVFLGLGGALIYPMGWMVHAGIAVALFTANRVSHKNAQHV